MSEEKENMTMKVCANPECEKPFIMEESETFILEVGLPDTVREESTDAASVLCVDCNMERLQDIYDITFVRSISTMITEEIKAYTPEEFEEYEKQKDTETDGA